MALAFEDTSLQLHLPQCVIQLTDHQLFQQDGKKKKKKGKRGASENGQPESGDAVMTKEEAATGFAKASEVAGVNTGARFQKSLAEMICETKEPARVLRIASDCLKPITEWAKLEPRCPPGWMKHRFAGQSLHCLQENGKLTVSYDGKSTDIRLHVPRSAGEAFARARNASQSHFCVQGFHDRIRNRLRVAQTSAVHVIFESSLSTSHYFEFAFTRTKRRFELRMLIEKPPDEIVLYYDHRIVDLNKLRVMFETQNHKISHVFPTVPPPERDGGVSISPGVMAAVNTSGAARRGVKRKSPTAASAPGAAAAASSGELEEKTPGISAEMMTLRQTNAHLVGEVERLRRALEDQLMTKQETSLSMPGGGAFGGAANKRRRTGGELGQAAAAFPGAQPPLSLMPPPGRPGSAPQPGTSSLHTTAFTFDDPSTHLHLSHPQPQQAMLSILGANSNSIGSGSDSRSLSTFSSHSSSSMQPMLLANANAIHDVKLGTAAAGIGHSSSGMSLSSSSSSSPTPGGEPVTARGRHDSSTMQDVAANGDGCSSRGSSLEKNPEEGVAVVTPMADDPHGVGVGVGVGVIPPMSMSTPMVNHQDSISSVSGSSLVGVGVVAPTPTSTPMARQDSTMSAMSSMSASLVDVGGGGHPGAAPTLERFNSSIDKVTYDGANELAELDLITSQTDPFRATLIDPSTHQQQEQQRMLAQSTTPMSTASGATPVVSSQMPPSAHTPLAHQQQQATNAAGNLTLHAMVDAIGTTGLQNSLGSTAAASVPSTPNGVLLNHQQLHQQHQQQQQLRASLSENSSVVQLSTDQAASFVLNASGVLQAHPELYLSLQQSLQPLFRDPLRSEELHDANGARPDSKTASVQCYPLVILRGDPGERVRSILTNVLECATLKPVQVVASEPRFRESQLLASTTADDPSGDILMPDSEKTKQSQENVVLLYSALIRARRSLVSSPVLCIVPSELPPSFRNLSPLPKRIRSILPRHTTVMVLDKRDYGSARLESSLAPKMANRLNQDWVQYSLWLCNGFKTFRSMYERETGKAYSRNTFRWFAQEFRKLPPHKREVYQRQELAQNNERLTWVKAHMKGARRAFFWYVPLSSRMTVLAMGVEIAWDFLRSSHPEVPQLHNARVFVGYGNGPTVFAMTDNRDFWYCLREQKGGNFKWYRYKWTERYLPLE